MPTVRRLNLSPHRKVLRLRAPSKNSKSEKKGRNKNKETKKRGLRAYFIGGEGSMSSKGIAQKLAMKENYKVLFINEPKGYRQILGELPKGVRIVKESMVRLIWFRSSWYQKRSLTNSWLGSRQRLLLRGFCGSPTQKGLQR